MSSVERLEQDPVTGPAPCAAADPACYDALPETAIWQQAIGLDQVPGKNRGRGVTVAVLDTGVTPSADLADRLLARVDLTAEHDGIDRFGHGSHLIGLVAGDGEQSLERYTGVGRGRRRGVGEGGRLGRRHRRHHGGRRAALGGGQPGPVRHPGGQPLVRHRRLLRTGTDPLDAALEQVWRAGIVVVTSAGNAGAAGTVTKPGDDPFTITVGSADTVGTATPADDLVAPFSSRGPTADGDAKPDLLAPGVSLVSLRAPGSTIDTFRPLARIGTPYFRGSGTSQSAAIVAGIAARMIGANPALTPDQVKGALLATTDRTLAGADGGGAGLVDAAAAVDLVTSGQPLPVANRGAVPSTGTGRSA